MTSRGIVLGLLVMGCGSRSRPEPARTEQGTRFERPATAATPAMRIEPGDGGALLLQVGGARARLPGENDRLPEPEGN